MLVCVYRDGRGPCGVQTTNSFDKSIMGKISKIGKAMKMSKAKSRDLMSFAALKKKLVIESGTDALNLKCVRPPPGCSPLVHGGSCVLSRGVLVCVCVVRAAACLSTNVQCWRRTGRTSSPRWAPAL